MSNPPNNKQVNFKVDKYTRELIRLTAERDGVPESEYIRNAIRDSVEAGMTRDGKGRSYYSVVIDMIADLKRGR
jgi:hypothetical protein